MKLASIALRNVRRNGRRSLLSMTAIAVAAMSIVLLFSLLAGMRADLEWNVQSYFTGRVRVRHRDFEANERLNPLHLRLTDYAALLDRVAALAGAADAVARIPFPAVADPNARNIKVLGLGVDFERERSFQKLDAMLKKGSLPAAGANEILLGAGLARRLGLGVGDRLTVMTSTIRRSPNAITFKVAGVAAFSLASINENWFYAPLDRVQYLLRMGGAATELLVKFDPRVSDDDAVAAVRGALDPGLPAEAKSWKQANSLIGVFGMMEVIYDLIALVFFVLASTVIINTTMMVIFERMREIGTIAAMGMNGGEITKLFFLEAFFLGLAGSAAGVALGIAFTLPLSRLGLDFSAGMQGVSMELSSVIYPRLNLRSTLFVFIFSTAVASLASFGPTRRAARIEPVEALRHIG